MYTKSDLTRAFLSIGTDGLSLRHLGVQALSNSKKRDELEKFKTFMLQLNTAGGDIYDLASIFTSDSMVELIQNARNTRAYNERQMQQQPQNQMPLTQHRILQEKIQAAGRAADAKSDATSLNFLASVSDQTVRQADIESKERIEDKKIENDSKLHDDEMRMKMEELKLKSKELAQRAMEDATKRYVAGINKN